MNYTLAELAKATGTTKQNVGQRLRRAGIAPVGIEKRTIAPKPAPPREIEVPVYGDDALEVLR